MKFWFLILALLLSACNLGFLPAPPSLPPTAVPADPTTQASPTGWVTLGNGIEQRLYTPNNDPLAALMAVRIDPQYFTFRVHYTPRQGLTLDQWRAALPQAAVIANANFFSPELTIQGLLISDGVIYGESYQGRGGMFAVQNGIPLVRSLSAEPYYGETLEQAAQAFPMLVYQSAAAVSNANQTQRSRRTLIGQTTDGKIILMATPLWGLGLYNLSAYLPTTDMQLWSAVNLDGGGSTMLYVAAANYSIPSFDAVPAVIAAYPR